MRDGLVLILAGCSLVLTSAAPGPAQENTPAAYSSDWDGALRRAQEKNLPVLLVFTAQRWSPASRQFVAGTLSAESLLRLDRTARELEQPPGHAWLVVHLDVSNAGERAREFEALREKYAVDRFPCALALTPDGRPCRTLALAGKGADAFLRELERTRAFEQAVQNLLGEAAPLLDLLAKDRPPAPEQTERFLAGLEGDVFRTLLDDGFASGYADLLRAAAVLDADNRRGHGLRAAGWLAQWALRAGRQEEFERYAEVIRKCDPDDRAGIMRSLRVGQLEVLVEQEAWEKTEAEGLRLLEAEDLESLAPQVWFFTALAAVHEGKPVIAKERLEKALSLNPEGEWVHEARVLLHRVRTQMEQAPAKAVDAPTEERF